MNNAPDDSIHILVDTTYPEVIETGSYENLIEKCHEQMERVVMRQNQLGEWESVYPTDSSFDDQPMFPRVK